MAVINIGAAAIDRATNGAVHMAWLNKENPANYTGRIKLIKTWLHEPCLTSFIPAIYYVVAGNTLRCRDLAIFATVAAGYVETVVDLEVEAGDYIGCYVSEEMELDSAGGQGLWYKAGAAGVPSKGNDIDYDFNANWTVSICGVGLTVAASFGGSQADVLVKNALI